MKNAVKLIIVSIALFSVNAFANVIVQDNETVLKRELDSIEIESNDINFSGYIFTDDVLSIIFKYNNNDMIDNIEKEESIGLTDRVESEVNAFYCSHKKLRTLINKSKYKVQTVYLSESETPYSVKDLSECN